MSKICDSFDAFFETWHAPLWRLCLLITRDRQGADEAAFQALLRLGAAKNPAISEEEARSLLFTSALRLCSDYYLKKMRHRPKRDRLAESLPWPLSDALWALLALPERRRAMLGLLAAGFSQEEAAQLLHISPAHAARLSAAPDIPCWEDALRDAVPDDSMAQLLSDRIYERFEVRSVGIENAIHDARHAFDRAAPVLALIVLAIFALSIWYVSR